MKVFRLFLIPLCLLFSAEIYLKAETSVTATVDRQTIPINESLTLVISISGDDITNSRPEMPNMPNFNVYSAGKSSNISMVNGRISSSMEYTYVLSPIYIGQTKIPAIPVSTGKERFMTKEIPVTVTKASVQKSHPSSGQHAQTRNPSPNMPREKLIFMRCDTDKKSAYEGEQITLRTRFYTAIPIASNPQYYPPKLTNLTSEDLPPITSGDVVIDGIRYYYSDIKTALFGIQAGKAVVGPSSVLAQIQKQEDIDPFDPNFMQKFFSGFANAENFTVTGKLPGSLEIMPLPEPQPQDFSGAVGNFFISAEADRKEAKRGDAINFTVKISGKGNIKMIQQPELKTQDFKLYDTAVSYNTTKNNDTIGGEKKFTYIISAKEEGEQYIPPVKFVFFNMDSRKYETLETQPIKINVLKGNETKAYNFTDAKNTSSPVTAISSDIKYIHENISPSLFSSLTAKAAGAPVYFHSFFFFPLVLALFLRLGRESRLRNPLLYAFKNADSTLNYKLKKALETGKTGQTGKALSLVYDAILDYLSDKSEEKLYSLTVPKMLERIKAKHPELNDYASGELKNFLEELEFLNYAPAGADFKILEGTVSRAKALAAILEKEFSK